MKKIFVLSLIMSAIFFLPFLSCKSKNKNSTAILVAAFGTSTDAIKTYDKIDDQIRNAYQNHYVTWGFTADFIVNKLKKQGKTTFGVNSNKVQSIKEAYDSLRSKNYKKVKVVTLLTVPGGEYKQLVETPHKGLEVKITDPIFAGNDWINNILNAVSPQFKTGDTMNVLVAHGNDHHPEFNKELVALDKAVRKKYKNAVLVTVEGQPGFEDGLEKALNSKYKKVHFIPMMYVAGDHVINDVMGDEKDSYKNIIGKPATCDKPLGENKMILDMIQKKLASI